MYIKIKAVISRQTQLYLSTYTLFHAGRSLASCSALYQTLCQQDQQVSAARCQIWYQKLQAGRFGWFQAEHPQCPDWTASLEALVARQTSDNGLYRETAWHLIETCHLEQAQFKQLVPQTASEKRAARQLLEQPRLAQLTSSERPLTVTARQTILTCAAQLEKAQQQQAIAHYGTPQDMATMLAVYEYQRPHAASATFKTMPLEELIFIVCHASFFSRDDQRQARIAYAEWLHQHTQTKYDQTTLNQLASTQTFLNRGYFGWFEADRYIDNDHDFMGTPESWLMDHFDDQVLFRRAAGRLIARYGLDQVALAGYDDAQA